MKINRILKPGLFITVEVKPGENWPFTIGSVSDDFNTITCELLMQRPRSLEIGKNERLVVVCAIEDGVYKFPTRVIEVEDDPIKLTLGLFKGVTHIQRREFFRLSKPLARARYRQIDGPEDIFDDRLIEVPVKDLSGNGMALIVPAEEELPKGTPIRAEIDFVGGQSVNLIGEVVRFIPNEPVNGKNLLCIHFSLIEERDRDRIVGNLFKEQLERAGRRRHPHRRD